MDLSAFVKLLQSGFPANEALLTVARLGVRPMLIKICLTNGADPNFVDQKTKKTALHFVSARGLPQMIQVLLDQPDCKVDLQDAEGKTPLMHAVQSKDGSALVALINACATPFL